MWHFMYYRQLAHVLITVKKIKLLHMFSNYIMVIQYFLHMQSVNRPGKRNLLTGKTSNTENVKIRLTLWIHFWILIASNYFSVTLVNFQIDALNSYLFIYNTFIKILYMFRELPWSSSGGLRRNCICAASGIVTLCR